MTQHQRGCGARANDNRWGAPAPCSTFGADVHPRPHANSPRVENRGSRIVSVRRRAIGLLTLADTTSAGGASSVGCGDVRRQRRVHRDCGTVGGGGSKGGKSG